MSNEEQKREQPENMTAGEWRIAWEQEAEENKLLRLRIEDLERSAASAREIARAAMSHTGTQAVRVEMCVRNDQLSLIICDPRGANYEDTLAERVAGYLRAHKWTVTNGGQVGSSG